MFTYFSSIFLKIMLKINVRLSLFMCHVCTVVVLLCEGNFIDRVHAVDVNGYT